jgi:1-acyl-sn-glycerol-3-phosphate acyltransferase
MLRRQARVGVVQVHGLAELSAIIGPNDGVLICPNHSHLADGPVMMQASSQAWRPFHFMAAWHVFRKHRGIDGWVLQRMGAFSIDREGCDRRAIRQAIDLLAGGQSLVVFPEGEIYHLNERLTPLREGVAFIAASAQRELDKSAAAARAAAGRVWVVPTYIRYEMLGDVRPALAKVMTELEERLVMKPRHDALLHERIIAFGEALLTLKETEYLGHACDRDRPRQERIDRLIEHLLARHEQIHLGRVNTDEKTPVRVKSLRRKLLESCDETGAGTLPPEVQDALRDVHLALQLFAYPGDYVGSRPTPERMTETVEKFMEDFLHTTRPIGLRRACVTFGDPIDVKALAGSARPRQLAAELTSKLESAIVRLIERQKADDVPREVAVTR